MVSVTAVFGVVEEGLNAFITVAGWSAWALTSADSSKKHP